MMIAEIVDRPNGEPDVMVHAEPECGDYCDACGDCLHCSHGTDYCDGRWVVYADIDPERAAELLALAAARQPTGSQP